jgi:hypothetical protein
MLGFDGNVTVVAESVDSDLNPDHIQVADRRDLLLELRVRAVHPLINLVGLEVDVGQKALVGAPADSTNQPTPDRFRRQLLGCTRRLVALGRFHCQFFYGIASLAFFTGLGNQLVDCAALTFGRDHRIARQRD